MPVASDIVTLQNESKYNSYVNSQQKAPTQSGNAIQSDYTMFLQLMLTQLENQDPTSPMENTEWLSQLAQYSSLEQMTAMNSNMESISTSLNNLSSDVLPTYSSCQYPLSII